MTSISLPIINRLVVKSYPLYPGKNNDGLNLNFTTGVSVLAGVNGIGKTTILHLIMRMLVGPGEPAKLDLNDIGKSSQRKIVYKKAFPFFSSRVATILDENSVATLNLKIGNKEVAICRRMKDMAIKYITIAGHKISQPTEDEVLKELADCSGIRTAYDYYMIVRFLQFIGEERLPILWSSKTQFAIFRMLFVDPTTAAELDRLQSKIMNIDSEYRNGNDQLRKRIDAIKPSEQVTNISIVNDQIAALQSEFDRIDKQKLKGDEQLTKLNDEKTELQDQVDVAEDYYDKALAKLTEADGQYVQNVLSTGVSDTIRFLAHGITTGSNCRVCGNQSGKAKAAIKRKKRERTCFFCDQSFIRVLPKNVDVIDQKRVQTFEKQFSTAEVQLDAANVKFDECKARYFNAVGNHQKLVTSHSSLRTRIDLLRASLPEGSEKLHSERSYIEKERNRLDGRKKERDELFVQFEKNVQKTAQSIADVTDGIRERFDHYAKTFSSETVLLKSDRLGKFKVAAGVSAISITSFRVHMTSGVSLSVTQRDKVSAVSESQREFLDLAFRMALLEQITNDKDLMLIIETPEASLDTWHMHGAARMIRKFTRSVSNTRLVVATSNLNGTKMIPALLGLCDGPEETVRKLPKDQGHRLIDLMSIAAKPMTLQDKEAAKVFENELRRISYA